MLWLKSAEAEPTGWPSPSEIKRASANANRLGSGLEEFKYLFRSPVAQAIVDRFTRVLIEDNEGLDPFKFLEHYNEFGLHDPDMELYIPSHLLPLRRLVEKWGVREKVEEEFGCLIFFFLGNRLSNPIRPDLGPAKMMDGIEFMNDWIEKKQMGLPT